MPGNSTVGDLGDTSLPLSPADFSTTLTPLEPARARLLALFETAIVHELTPVWEKIVATIAAGHALTGDNPPTTSKAVIADRLELPPTQWALQQRKTDFPLLCCFPFGEAAWSEHTLELEKREQNWRLVYVLPPLDVADLHKIGDVTRGVVAVVRRVIRERGHKAYEGGALQFFSGVGGLGSVRLTGEMTGPAQFSEGADAPIYHAVTLTLAVTEYATDSAEEFGTFEAVDFSVGVGEEQTAVPDLIQGWSDVEVE